MEEILLPQAFLRGSEQAGQPERRRRSEGQNAEGRSEGGGTGGKSPPPRGTGSHLWVLSAEAS